jgi:hypothetical protein
MTIKQQGGVFGRNPTFNEVTIDSTLSVDGTSQFSDDVSLLRSNLSISKAFNGSSEINFYNDAPTSPSSFKIVVNDLEEVLFDLDPDASLAAARDLIVRGDGATEIARFNVAGNVTLPTGNLVIGTSGNGIDFSATSGTGTSELFDDYEEGTFTPVVADAASGGNEGTASSAFGYYTKVGRQVTIQITFLNIDTTGMTGANDLYITGLPFSCESLAGINYFTGNMSAALLANTLGIGSPEVLDSTSYMRIREWGNNTGTDFSLVSDLTSGASDLNITLTYFAA